MFTRKWSEWPPPDEQRGHRKMSRLIRRAAPRGTRGAVLVISFSRAGALARPPGKDGGGGRAPGHKE